MTPITGTDTRTIGGYTLRGVLAAGVLATVICVLVGGTGVGVLTAMGIALVALGVGTVAAPGSLAPALLLIVAVAGQLLTAGDVLDVRLGVLAAAMLLVHQLSAVCVGIPLSSTVDLAALRPMALRYLLCVAVVEVGIAVGAVFS